MGKTPLSDVESGILVLATISKLSGRNGRLSVEATTDRFQRTLKETYGRDLTKREVENILRDLLDRGFIFKEKGLLSDGRAVLYGINPSKISQEPFTIIKIDRERAYVHNGHEGIVYDPPRVEEENPKTTNTGSFLLRGLVTFGITVTLLSLAVNHEGVAQQIQKDAILLYPEETESNIGKKANTLTYAGDYLTTPILLYPNS